ncbi:MAG: hypothetical protein IPK71_25510 [Myxococcales bacterium]|nr:hypothetical protein [Myxococcales bacterium]
MGPTMPEAALVAETLTVAMAVAPGVYSRNRHFSLHQRPEARAARRRAALVRGIVRHLAVAVDVRVERASGDDEGALEVSYRVAALAFERTARLSSAELACVRYLARKVGVTLPPALTLGTTPETDSALVEATLARLSPAR